LVAATQFFEKPEPHTCREGGSIREGDSFEFRRQTLSGLLPPKETEGITYSLRGT
jgi:hypothetical protein